MGIVMAAITLVGCQTAKQMTYLPNAEEQGTISTMPVPEEITLQPMDSIRIAVFALDEEAIGKYLMGEHTYIINAHGQISLPLIGPVSIAGLTLDETKDTLTLQIGRILKHPVIHLAMAPMSASVLGEVMAPGLYPIRQGMTLWELLAQAGDITYNGRRDNILVLRRNGSTTQTYRIDLRQNTLMSSPAYYIRRGDIIIVSPKFGRRNYGYHRVD